MGHEDFHGQRAVEVLFREYYFHPLKLRTVVSAHPEELKDPEQGPDERGHQQDVVVVVDYFLLQLVVFRAESQVLYEGEGVEQLNADVENELEENPVEIEALVRVDLPMVLQHDELVFVLEDAEAKGSHGDERGNVEVDESLEVVWLEHERKLSFLQQQA